MIIQSWDSLSKNGKVSQFDIQSPYWTSVQTDTQFEQGGIDSSKISQLQVSEIDIAESPTAVSSIGKITITQSHTGQRIINLNSDGGLILEAGQNYISFADGVIEEDMTFSSRGTMNFYPSGDFAVHASGSIASIASGNIYEEPSDEFVVSANGSFVLQAPHGLLEVDGDDLLLYAVGGAIVGNGTEIVSSSGTKTAIMKTSKGYKALYTTESPDVWFMDFAKVLRPRFWQFWKKPIAICDPLFLEVTERPYITMPTTNKNMVQIWARRKGTRGLRFAKKTKEEFNKNKEFWDTPRVDKRPK